MIRVLFRNLKRSELIETYAKERIIYALSRFPMASIPDSVITLSMDNSPSQPGRDVFRAKIQINGGTYRGISHESEADDLYIAVNDLSHALLGRLNRFSDRRRVIRIHQNRKFLRSVKPYLTLQPYEEDELRFAT